MALPTLLKGDESYYLRGFSYEFLIKKSERG
jgi:hypothetical protein